MCAVQRWVRLGVVGLAILQWVTWSGRAPLVQTPTVPVAAMVAWVGPLDPCHDTTCG